MAVLFTSLASLNSACVDEAEATYHTASPTANTWAELYALLKSWTACTFVAGSTTMLPALMHGKDRDLIQSEMGFPQLRHSLAGDNMSVISVDPLHTEEQYREFLKRRCEEPEAVDLKQLHLNSSGRYRSIARYLANQSVGDNLNSRCRVTLATRSWRAWCPSYAWRSTRRSQTRSRSGAFLWGPSCSG